jgi:hypothetical protein
VDEMRQVSRVPSRILPMDGCLAMRGVDLSRRSPSSRSSRPEGVPHGSRLTRRTSDALLRRSEFGGAHGPAEEHRRSRLGGSVVVVFEEVDRGGVEPPKILARIGARQQWMIGVGINVQKTSNIAAFP